MEPTRAEPPAPRGPGLTPLQQLVVAGLAVAAVVLVVVLVAGDGGDARKVAAGPSSSSSTTTTTEASDSTTTLAPTSTTIDLQPVDSTPATTAATTTTTTTRPPPAPEVSAAGAVLTPPSSVVLRTLNAAQGCASLADSDAAQIRCEIVPAGGSVAWLIQERKAFLGSQVARRAQVFHRVDNSTQWTLALEARDDDGTLFADVTERTIDLSGDDVPEIVFGFRSHGTGQFLEVDVVEAPGVVLAHQELARGSVRLSPGQLDTWDAVYADTDPGCCPSSFSHRTVRRGAGVYRVVATAAVRPDAVPPSQL